MSYDLFLTSSRLCPDAFAQYFSQRPNYEQPGWYVNPDTGVYFQFEFQQPEPDEGRLDENVAFSLNYFRPHTFGLEAEPEVAAFVAAFGCTIHDPQFEGMGDGPYSADGFLRGWNKGNAFGYASIAPRGGLADVLLADKAQIERVWRWNLGLKSLQGTVGEGHFLPRANWGKRLSNGATIVFAIWGEGVWTAFPDCVTHVLLMRKRTVSNGWFSREKKEIMEAKLISMEEVVSLEGCAWRETGGGRLLFAPVGTQPSRQILSLFGKQFTEPKTIVQQYGPDHVLDASLMTEVMKGQEK